MSEQLSPYQFAQLLVDVAMASYNKNVVGRKGGKFKPIAFTEKFGKQKEIRTYDVSTESTILFNENTEYDTIDITLRVKDEPVSYVLTDSPWPFNGEKNE